MVNARIVAAPKLDLRAVRTTFFDKQLAYALSYDYSAVCAGSAPTSESVRLLVRPLGRADANAPAAPRPSDGDVFHVLGVDRIAGIANVDHDVPAGFQVHLSSETVLLRPSSTAAAYPTATKGRAPFSVGTIEGRMLLTAGAKGEKVDGQPLCISVTYDGTLELVDPVDAAGFVAGLKEPTQANAFVIPFFETTHPKYHWLTENACIAFGTWELRPEGKVYASFDVYCAE